GFVDFDTRTDFQVFDPAPRQLAVAGELADAVVDVAIAGRVSIALVDQRLDHAEHAVDMLGGTRLDIWTQYVQARLVFMHGGDHALDQRFEGLTILLRTADNLVVDVSDI